MTVTTAQIRDLLNRPRGLNEGTITEYLTIRTAEVNKKARSNTLYGLGDSVGTDDVSKESAIKLLVACDCLRIMLDTIPSYVPEPEQRRTDIRIRAQLTNFEKRADEMLAAIAEVGGSAFVVSNTKTRTETV
tara:strand:- start:1609 stop:2004 length:396 start_codon:yes stop_codon:yes gene_type:complete